MVRPTHVYTIGYFATLIRENIEPIRKSPATRTTSTWASLSSVAGKIGRMALTLNEWVRKAGVKCGKRAGLPSDVAEKMKAPERENRELRQSNDICAGPLHISLGPFQRMHAFAERGPGTSTAH